MAGRRPPARVTERWLRNSGLAYLRRYPATSGRFRAVMRRKIARSLSHHGGDPEEAAALLDKLVGQLTEAGALDDRRFIEARVEELWRRGASRRGIRAKLAQQVAAPELVDEALAALAREHSEPELTAAVALARRRRLGPFRASADERTEHRQKDLGALARAGFSWSIASQVIDAESPDDLLEELD